MGWTLETAKDILTIGGGITGGLYGFWKLWGKKLWSKWYSHYKANRNQWRTFIISQMREIKNGQREMVNAQKEMAKEFYPNGGQSMTDKLLRLEEKMDINNKNLEHQNKALLSLQRGQRLNREVMNIPNWESDANGDFVYISPSMSDLFGCVPDELMGSSWIGMIVHEDRERVERLWINSIKNASYFNEVFQIRRCSDNTIVKVNATAVHIKDAVGKVESSLGKVVSGC